MERMYLDYAAATPVDPRVLAVMEPFFSVHFGNPSSVHKEGCFAQDAVARARAHVATLLRAHPEEIIFTSGTTEALHRVFSFAQEMGALCAHSAFEHTAGRFAGAQIFSSLDEVLVCAQDGANFFSAAWVNGETGGCFPVHDAVIAVKKFSARDGKRRFFHSDISQALLTEDISCERTPIDFLSFSAAKLYGPKGVGALFVRRGNELPSLFSGGRQEQGMRPGTENVPGIVGFGEACRLLSEHRAAYVAHMHEVRTAFLAGLAQEGVRYRVQEHERASPGILSVTFFGISAEEFVLRLDAQGVACSAAAACVRAGERSSVLRGLGLSDADILSTVRFSFGTPLLSSQAQRAGALTATLVRRMLQGNFV